MNNQDVTACIHCGAPLNYSPGDFLYSRVCNDCQDSGLTDPPEEDDDEGSSLTLAEYRDAEAAWREETTGTATPGLLRSDELGEEIAGTCTLCGSEVPWDEALHAGECGNCGNPITV